MRTFKPTYRDKKGKTKKVSKWWIELRDHREIVRRFAGFQDKDATKALGRRIQTLVSYKVAGEPHSPEISRWLEGIPNKLSKRLIETGILDESKSQVNKALTEHVQDFEFMMLRSCNQKYAKQAVSKIRRIIEACKFSQWSDINGNEIERYLDTLCKDGLSKQTAKYYAVAFRHFAKWMVENKRANEIPKIHIGKFKRNNRPAFEIDEFNRILEAAINGPERYGLTGYERYLLYKVATETGMRRAELLSLTVASFNHKDRTLFLKGEEHTKHTEDVLQEISESTATELKNYIYGKMPNVKLFPLRRKQDSSVMIHEDCEAAGVNIFNDKGEKRTFHSLRHCCGSFLADAGCHPKVIQSIMRHKDINLTMTRYTHTLRNQKRKAVNNLPDFTIKRATGTDKLSG